MRRSPAWMIGLLVAAWGSPGDCQSSAPRPVHTSKSRFAIPFRSDAAEMQHLGAREVRLFVSVDAGSNWHHVQSVTAAAARFTVRPPKDGEYWFAVRTVDREGRLHPEGKLAAEMKVVVDTRSPTLDVKLAPLPDGRVQLAWTAADQHLDANSLVLEYRAGGENAWQSLSVTPASVGKTSWDIPQGGMVEARGRIADFAANVALATTSIRIAGTRNNVPRPSVPDADSDPIAAVIQNGAKDAGMPATFPAAVDRRSQTKTGPDLQGFQAAQQAAGPARGVSARRTIGGPASEPGPDVVPQHAAPSNAGRRPSSRFAQFPGTAPRASGIEPSVARRLVNRKRFQLNYVVDRIGRSGVEAVELFITVNDGGKWYRYGTDPDGNSPFEVAVPDDGTYGFAIRVRSGAGISDPPPQPGEKPAIVVVVDQAAPRVQLLPILQGRGSDADKFLIRWTMSDAHPAEKPVSIAYSESDRGPWRTICGWQAAQGSYLWTTSGDVPARIYVRLTARDAAGNVSAVQTQRPIIVDVVKPSARITTVDVSSD